MALPGGNDDLATSYSTQDYLDVDTDNGVYVGIDGSGAVYMVHQFKDYVGTETTVNLEWNGKSSLAPSSATVYLQIYNENTLNWETIGSNGLADADTDFTIQAQIADLTDYVDGAGLITCRVYQQGI